MLRFNNIYVFCLDDSLFRHIFKQQITDLILIINENNIEITSMKTIPRMFMQLSLDFFENLKHLTIIAIIYQQLSTFITYIIYHQ